MRQSQLLTGISVVWGILELETSPRNTVDALRFERRAASYAGSAGFGGVAKVSIRECFSTSIFFVIHLRSN
jgi:hypothetical protein